jgi:hypothetical protein
LTPGRRLVVSLDKLLPEGCEWDERERAALDSVESMADRLASLRLRCDKVLADPDVSPTSIATLSSEVRRLEVSLHQLIASLKPDPATEAKSARHVAAANARWSRG